MVATRIFNTSAVGRMMGVASPKRVITAMYPDAPAWPTDEYKNAIMVTARKRETRCDESIASTDVEVALLYVFAAQTQARHGTPQDMPPNDKHE